jgi:hypothetical protein
MLYLQGDDGNLKIIILETGNLEELKKGRPAKTPDSTVLIAWTPDPQWLADEIAKTGGDPNRIARLIDEAAKRPQTDLRSFRSNRKINLGGNNE